MTDLATLADVKLSLRVKNSDDDALLQLMITRASAVIEKYIEREVKPRVYTELRDGSGRDRLVFRDYPVTAVTSVRVNDEVVLPSIGVGKSGYVFDRTTLTVRGRVFDRGRCNVELIYVAGFDRVPDDIVEACIELVSLRYKELDRVGFQSKSLAGETVSFIVSDMAPSTRAKLREYKRVMMP